MFKINLKEFKADESKIRNARGLGEGGKVQVFVDSECLRLMTPYTPLDTSALISSATAHTKIGSGKIVQQTPYARRWYYNDANFQGAPKRGKAWFARMKNDNRESILKGAKRIARAK